MQDHRFSPAACIVIMMASCGFHCLPSYLSVKPVINIISNYVNLGANIQLGNGLYSGTTVQLSMLVALSQSYG